MATEAAAARQGRLEPFVEPFGAAGHKPELLMIEATGDCARAQRLLTSYGVSTPEIESVTARLKDIPVDITPDFPAAGETE